MKIDILYKMGFRFIFWVMIFLSFSSSIFSSVESIKVTINESITDYGFIEYYLNSKPFHTNDNNDFNANNLVMMFPFNSNLTRNLDYSSNGFSFVEYGGAGLSYETALCSGTDGGCYDFDGSAGYLEVPFDAEFNTDVFSVSLWAKIEGGTGTYRSPITSRDNPFSGFIIYASSSNIWQFWLGDGVGWTTMSGSGVVLNEWIFLTIQYDGVNMKIFENGVEVNSVGSSFVKNTAQPLRIGAGVTEGPADYFFDGKIEDVRAYNRTLSDDEIMVIYSDMESSFSGEIVVENVNGVETLSDIEIFVNNSNRIAYPELDSGRFGFMINNTVDNLTLFVPELQPGEQTVFSYDIFPVRKFPLLINTSALSSRIQSGTVAPMIDSVKNVFEVESYQNGCIYDAMIIQEGLELLSGVDVKFRFIPASLGGGDSGNVVFSNADSLLNWDINAGACMPFDTPFNIDYDVLLPQTTNGTGNYNITNMSLSFKLNDTFSGVRIGEILGISSGNLTLEKEIIDVANSNVLDSNVTWQVNSSFSTKSNLNYVLEKATMWVSEKSVDGLYTNMSKVEVDSVSGASLNQNLVPGSVVNLSSPWVSTNWNFNFSGFDSPLVWFDVDFTIQDDGVQIKDSVSAKSSDSFYLKSVGLVTGYVLSINKSVKNIGEDLYNVNIVVVNKGNTHTPSNAVVTVYDMLPSNFAVDGSLDYSDSPWYSVGFSNNSVVGDINGTLFQWAITPTNTKDASLDFGSGVEENNSFVINFNISGSGEYKYLDVFITGLDPQKVAGAGSSRTVVMFDTFVDEMGYNSWFIISAVLLFVLVLLI